MLGVGTVFGVLPLKRKAIYSLKTFIGYRSWSFDNVYLIFVQNNNIGKRIKRFIFSTTMTVRNLAREAAVLVGGVVNFVVARGRFCLGVGAYKGIFGLFEVGNVNNLMVKRLRVGRQTIGTIVFLSVIVVF